MTTSAIPAWFDRELVESAAVDEINVHGARIRYRCLGAPDAPTMLFLHGGRAHARWWDPVVSLMGDGFRTIAMDLSGHGDSDWRESYTVQLWEDEVLEVAEAAAPDGCIVVGHSLGGILGMRVGQRAHPLIHGLVSVDAAPGGVPAGAPRLAPPGQGPTWFPTIGAAVAEFGSRAARANWPGWLVEHVGAMSVRPDGDGWVWKHDASTSGTRRRRGDVTELGTVPLAFILGGASLFTPLANDSEWWSRFPDTTESLRIEVSGAGHDVMAEQPVYFTECLRRVVAQWGGC